MSLRFSVTSAQKMYLNPYNATNISSSVTVVTCSIGLQFISGLFFNVAATVFTKQSTSVSRIAGLPNILQFKYNFLVRCGKMDNDFVV
jgi:hypothetical protein